MQVGKVDGKGPDFGRERRDLLILNPQGGGGILVSLAGFLKLRRVLPRRQRIFLHAGGGGVKKLQGRGRALRIGAELVQQTQYVVTT